MTKNNARLFSALFLGLLLVGAPLMAKEPDTTSKPVIKTSPKIMPAPKSTTQTEREEFPEESMKKLATIAEVWARVKADYVEQVTDDKLMDSALSGMLTSLDPHSGYMNKKDFTTMRTDTKGEFGGLGIEITLDKGLIKVISPIDDTPAARAKIQSGDLITHINNKLVTEMTLDEAVDKMRGTPGTKVTLTLRRGGISGKPFDLTLIRAVIRVQAVKSEAKGNVAYIRITTFNEQTQAGLDKALADLQKKLGTKLAGYVIDLRNNPGGLLDQAISVSSSFLQAGQEVVSTRGRQKGDDGSFVAQGGDKTRGKPIVVLINGGSASASEIVAGALQDHRRAVLLGTKSFGKGSVQTIIPMASGGAIRLTTARYFTPSGRSIQALGIEPDIIVKPAKIEPVDQDKGLHEADLKGALANPDGVKDDKKSADDKDDGNKKDDFDYQLERGMDVVRGMGLIQGGAK